MMMVHIIDFGESHTKLASRQIHFTLALVFAVGCLVFKNWNESNVYKSISKLFLRCHRLCRLMVMMMMSVRCKHILIKWLITLGRIRCLWRETVSLLIKMHRHLTFGNSLVTFGRLFLQTVNFGVAFIPFVMNKKETNVTKDKIRKVVFLNAGDGNTLRKK